VARRLGSQEVIDTLAEVMLVRGIPAHLRSDNGPEFVARELRHWLAKLGTGTLYMSQEALGRTATARASTAS
jgi:hypothetical protein